MDKYIYSFVTLLFGTIAFVILNRLLSTSYKKSIEKSFVLILVLTIIFCIVDSFWGALTIITETHTSNTHAIAVTLEVFTYFWHILISLCAFAYSEYIVSYLGSGYTHKKVIFISRFMLLVAMFAIVLVNIGTNVLFSIQDSIYVISRTRYVLFIFICIFFFAGTLFSSIQAAKTKEKREKRQCIAAILFNVIPLIACALQLVPGGTKVPLFSASFSISITILFIFNLNDIKESFLHDQYDTESILRKENLETIRILSSDYTSIYYVDLETSNMTIYRVSDDVASIFGDVLYKQVNFTQVLMFYLEQRVKNSDKEELMAYGDPEFLRSLVKDQDIYTHIYRVGTEDDFRYAQMKIVKVNPEERAKEIILGISDIDEQVKAEKEYQKQLEEAKKQADSASQAKTSFLFNMSHDIRTPINAIIGFTQLAKKHMDEQERVADCLNKVESASEHLLSLINDVLDMSRIESGKFNIENHLTNILESISSTIAMLNVTAKNKDITLTSKIDITHINLIMDDLHIGRALINIVGNSIKYTNANGIVDLSVKESASEKENFAKYTFVVKDNGIGMDKEFVEHIFEAFSREESATVSKIQGTGLGMAITKQLVDKLGGTIKVESEKGVGTTVTLTFDLEISQESAIKDSEVEIDSNVLKDKKVLLVEDNELNREIATEILVENGLIVESAEDGVIAVNKITSKDPSYYDFVLMDIQMPNMNGYDATIKIRTEKEGKYKDLVIIAMTANAFDEDKKQALAVGMNGHIAKPIDIDNLLSTITSLLKK